MEKYGVGVSGVLCQAEKPTKGSALGMREEDMVNKNEQEEDGATQVYSLIILLELCAWNRNPEVNTDDPKDRMTSILGCQSFTFSLADALELHRT